MPAASPGAACIVGGVSRNRILVLVVTGILVLMAGVLLYKAFDVQDTRAFGVDPEIPLFMLSSLALLCLGAVAVRGTSDLRGKLNVAAFERPKPIWNPLGPLAAFCQEHLLFSPPLAILSLRV